MNRFLKLRNETGLSQRKFGAKYNIPWRTIQDWEKETRTPPEYVYELLKFKVECDLAEFRKGIIEEGE